jgi:neutral ceramidase
MRSTHEYRSGFGRADISVFEPGFCMFGWGHPDNVPTRVDRPLFARAWLVEDVRSKARLAYVCCDLGMIAEALRQEVLVLTRQAGLPLEDDELVLTATHTHSAPNGTSTYLMYALGGPGFSPRVFNTIAKGIVDALLAAARGLAPARLFLHSDTIPLSEPILFNRSPEAYSKNADVVPVSFARRDEATNRTMTVVRVDALDGRPLGLVSWLACHPTTIHRDATYLHPDHKGEASLCLEERAAREGDDRFVALFAQGAAGDVTANHRFSPERRQMIGRFDDDRESARFAGERQAHHAKRIASLAVEHGHELHGEVVTRVTYTDFFSAPVDPRFAAGREGLRTGSPRVGLPFPVGTLEGPGPLAPVARAIPMFSALQRARRRLGLLSRDAAPHGGKFSFWELGKGSKSRVFGLVRPAQIARYIPNKFARYIAAAAEHPEMIERPWVPRYLPGHLAKIGKLVVASTPNEPTTTCGRRLAEVVRRALPDEDVHVVVCGYTNAYAGYLTTPEEYAAQSYEGGASLFGENALPAWCTVFDRLACSARPSAKACSPGTPPPHVRPADCVPFV